jgi:hypothetical protein
LLLLELFFSWVILNDSPNQTHISPQDAANSAQIPAQDTTNSAQDTANSAQNTANPKKIFFKAPTNVVGSPWQGV